MKKIITFLLLLGIIIMLGCSKKNKNFGETQYTSAKTHRATMRAYNIRGKRYSPTYVEVGQTMRGISSWYGPHFHGKHTSNGERYNMHGLTAAHKTWPMDTMVKVTNLQNNKSVTVRINDRGPFVRGRIIDCSYQAGKQIGLDGMGIAKVHVQVVGFAGKILKPKVIAKMKREKTPIRVQLSNFGIQVGAFRRYAGAKIYQRKYQKRYLWNKTVIKSFSHADGKPLYRVWIMGYGSEEEAEDFRRTHSLGDAFIIHH